MKYFYFSILFAVLSLFSGGLFYFNQEFLRISENAVSSNFQANLTAIKFNETKNKDNLSEEKPINLLFVGDIMLGRGVENVFEKYGNSRYPFLKTFEISKYADLTFGNLEGPISQNGKNQGSIYSFRFEPMVLEGLKFAGFDVLSLANNHSIDYGPEALENTISILRENKIEPIGAGRNYLEANKPVIFEIKTKSDSGLKIAFLAYTTLYPKSYEAHSIYSGQAGDDYSGISSFDIERIKDEIKVMKALKIADIVVVSIHWGEEYQNRSNKNQQNIGHALAEAGVDLIIGHHPHVIQEIERYKNSWIAYSLGNFIFDQNFSKETMNGLMLKAIVRDKKIIDIEPIGIKINDSFQPEVISL